MKIKEIAVLVLQVSISLYINGLHCREFVCLKLTSWSVLASKPIGGLQISIGQIVYRSLGLSVSSPL